MNRRKFLFILISISKFVVLSSLVFFVWYFFSDWYLKNKSGIQKAYNAVEQANEEYVRESNRTYLQTLLSRRSWLYKNVKFYMILLFTIYINILIFQIVYFLVKRYNFKRPIDKSDIYFILDFIGIIFLIWVIHQLSKKRSLIKKEIEYQDFNGLDNIHKKKRSLVNGLINNDITPQQFEYKMQELEEDQE